MKLIACNELNNLIKIQPFIILSYEHLTASHVQTTFVISISGNFTSQSKCNFDYVVFGFLTF